MRDRLWLFKLFCVWMSLLLIGAPLYHVEGQEAAENGKTGANDDAPALVEEAVMSSLMDLPYHTFLPVIQAGVLEEVDLTAAATSPLPQIPSGSRECAMRYPPTIRVNQPYWLFVLNFNVWQNGNPVACVLIYPRTQPLDTPQPYTTALRVPCQAVVQPAASVNNATGGRFSGGYLRCRINLKNEIDRLNIRDGLDTIILQPEYNYPQFTIIGRGQLEAVGSTTHPFANPIVAYQPLKNGLATPDVAFFAPRLPSNKARMVSYYRNGVNYVTNGGAGQCVFGLTTAPLPQIWTMQRVDNQVKHYLNGSLPGLVCPAYIGPNVTFWTDGEFYIGGSTLGPTFRGWLDEVIVDPTGSIVPPGS